MKRIIVSLFLLGCYKVSFALVSLQLESPKVELGQTFTLTLKVEGTKNNAVPDLTPLQQDFAIVGTESNMSYSIINGKVSAVSEWAILLMPKQSGVFTIPALRIGQEKTSPIKIEVTDQSVSTPTDDKQQDIKQQQQPIKEDVVLLAEVSEKKPYVNQQVIYTVKLLNSSRLINTSYQPPQVEDALFVPFGNGKRYQISSNGRLYAVEEQQFALFPQKSGNLKIKPPFFSAVLYDLAGPRRVNVHAQPTVLQVQPIPAHSKGKNWLPAKQVFLSESYDKNITTLTEGSTLVRTVTLQAVAVPAQLLPALDFGISDQFNIYPEKPSEHNEFKQQDLVGTLTVRVNYLFNKAGQINVPPLTLPWFNTTIGKQEISSLPGFTITITPANAAEQNQAPTQAKPQEPATASALKVTKESAPVTISSKSSTNLAWWLASGFALAWLVTVFAWLWQRRNRPSGRHYKNQVLKQLQEACLKNNPYQTRDALLKWGQWQWPDKNLLNLHDLAQLINKPMLKQEIIHLAQALYSPTAGQNWQGQKLWENICNFKSTKGKKEKSKDTLPPIHRL